jgi:hypothetical protein
LWCKGREVRVFRKNSRQTIELAHQVSELCKVMTAEDVAVFEHLHWQRELDINKRAIQKAQSERSLEGITVLGVDEISVGQGHNYWHLIKIIYDKFHVMRHLLNALNKIRKAEFRSAGKEMKRILTGRKFILLKRISNLRGKRGRLLRGY